MTINEEELFYNPLDSHYNALMHLQQNDEVNP